MSTEPEQASTHKSPSSENARVISCTMSAGDIIEELAKRGCPDLTTSIDAADRSKNPVAGGGFCDVYSALLRDGSKVAIKSLRVHESHRGEGNKKKILKRAARELCHWARLQHPNILPLMGLAFFQNRVSMISKWVDNGNLPMFLARHPGANRLAFCKDICAGLQYVHQDDMVHGDLKAVNVMVSSDGVAMLTDFGNAHHRDIMNQFTKTGRPSISFRWAAPELINDQARPSKESDVYAYAMTVLEVITGNLPYEGLGNLKVWADLAAGGKHPLRPDTGVHDRFWDMLKSCWAREPANRPNAEGVMHWLSEFDEIGHSVCGRVPMKTGASPSKANRDHPQTSNPCSYIVASRISPREAIDFLRNQGCRDLTPYLDAASCSETPVGGGGFADLHAGMLLDRTRIAIKAVRTHAAEASEIHSVVQNIARELYIWSRCRHPNILQSMGFAVFRGEIALISPWAQSGSIMAYLHLNPYVDRCSLSTGVCEAVSYLHSNNIIHGDIKGANVLISGSGTPVLADFGNSRISSSEVIFEMSESVGLSLRWTAPELLIDEPSKVENTTDAYSLGMTILEIVSGQIPYEGVSEHRVLRLVAFRKIGPQRPEAAIPSRSPSGDILWALLESCWAWKPKQRPSAHQIRDTMKLITQDKLVPFEESDVSDDEF